MHDAAGVGPVVTVLHCTVDEGEQLATPAGVVQPQVVVVQLLLELAVAAVQPSGTETFVVVTTGQVVVTQPLPDDAVAGVHDPVGVGPVVCVPQVVAV